MTSSSASSSFFIHLSPTAAAAAAMPRFIDIGANLTDGMFQGMYHGKRYHEPDLDVVLKRGWDAGLERVMVTAGTLDEAREALALAEAMDGGGGDDRDDDTCHGTSEEGGGEGRTPGVERERRRLFTTVGVHPTRCGEFEASGDAEKYLADLKAVAMDNMMMRRGTGGGRGGRVVAIGECGLDYDRTQFCDRTTQLRWFERQFELSEATGLPMFLHMRAAAEDFTDVVLRNRHRFSAAVVHSFTGTAEEADALLAIEGVYIGINGCSLRTSESLEVAKNLPADRIMLETDAPWCGIKNSHPGAGLVHSTWPTKDKKKRAGVDTGECVKDRSEPCHVAQVLEVLAATKGMAKEELAEVCYANTVKVFFPDEAEAE